MNENMKVIPQQNKDM